MDAVTIALLVGICVVSLGFFGFIIYHIVRSGQYKDSIDQANKSIRRVVVQEECRPVQRVVQEECAVRIQTQIERVREECPPAQKIVQEECPKQQICPPAEVKEECPQTITNYHKLPQTLSVYPGQVYPTKPHYDFGGIIMSEEPNPYVYDEMMMHPVYEEGMMVPSFSPRMFMPTEGNYVYVHQECPSPFDPKFQIRTGTLGINVLPRTNDVDQIMIKVQDAISLSQRYACDSLKQYSDEIKSSLLNEVHEEDITSLNCSDVIKKFKDLLDNARISVFGTNDIKGLALMEALHDVYSSVLLLVCKDDKIDPIKATQLFSDIFDSICPP